MRFPVQEWRTSPMNSRMLYSLEYAASKPCLLAISYAPDSVMSDESINLKRLAQMDPRAVAEVHDRYFAELFRYARYRVSSPDVAEDIVSDVFVRLLEAVGGGKTPHTNLRGWLLSTCSNAVNDYFRRIYRHDVAELAESVAEDSPGPVSILDNQEDRAELQAALAQLTPDQQHVVALRFGAGCTLRETATLMGRRVNAVKALQFRAIQALRRQMSVDQS